MKDGVDIDAPVNFKALCESQIENNKEALALWADLDTRAVAIYFVHERARVVLEERAAERFTE